MQSASTGSRPWLQSYGPAGPPENLDFEKDFVDEPPAVWVVSAEGYKADVVDEGAKQGRTQG